MHGPKISVIVPTYNDEYKLISCIGSIHLQYRDDMEVIIVDDGSTDKTPAICDQIAEKYNYIRVIHKENGGASSARNAGIEASRGKYLFFVDADDYILPPYSLHMRSYPSCVNKLNPLGID